MVRLIINFLNSFSDLQNIASFSLLDLIDSIPQCIDLLVSCSNIDVLKFAYLSVCHSNDSISVSLKPHVMSDHDHGNFPFEI